MANFNYVYNMLLILSKYKILSQIPMQCGFQHNLRRIVRLCPSTEKHFWTPWLHVLFFTLNLIGTFT